MYHFKFIHPEQFMIETLILKGLLKTEYIHSDEGTGWETITVLIYLLVAQRIYYLFIINIYLLNSIINKY